MLGKTNLVSPMIADHFIKGLTSSVGSALLAIADVVIRARTNTPSTGKGFYGKTVRDIPGMSSLVAKDNFSQDIDTSYSLREELSKLHATHSGLKAEGRRAEAKVYKEEHKQELRGGVQKRVNHLNERVDKLNKQLRKLSEIPNERMSPEAKKVRRETIEARIRNTQAKFNKIQTKLHPD
jgi:exonuclease VII large subunit